MGQARHAMLWPRKQTKTEEKHKTIKCYRAATSDFFTVKTCSVVGTKRSGKATIRTWAISRLSGWFIGQTRTDKAKLDNCERRPTTSADFPSHDWHLTVHSVDDYHSTRIFLLFPSRLPNCRCPNFSRCFIAETSVGTMGNFSSENEAEVIFDFNFLHGKSLSNGAPRWIPKVAGFLELDTSFCTCA